MWPFPNATLSPCTYIPCTPTPKSSCDSVAVALAAGWWLRSNVSNYHTLVVREKDLMTRGASFPFSHLTAWLAQHSRQICPLRVALSPTTHISGPPALEIAASIMLHPREERSLIGQVVKRVFRLSILGLQACIEISLLPSCVPVVLACSSILRICQSKSDHSLLEARHKDQVKDTAVFLQYPP